MCCTPHPEGLKRTATAVVNATDARKWRLPKNKTAELVYDERSGDVMANGERCPRVFDPEPLADVPS